jgi:hypothetical protein
MRMERNQDRIKLAPLAFFAKLPQDLLVPKMDAVECTKSGDDPSITGLLEALDTFDKRRCQFNTRM